MILNNGLQQRAPRFFFKNIFQSLLFFLVAFVFLLPGCEAESSFLGLEIQPPSDRLFPKFTTVNTVKAFTFEVDSIEADNYSIQLLGEIADPVFGISKADFFSQMVMSSYKFDFGVNPVADSMFLTLRLAGSYGNKTTPHIIKIYELTQALYYDSTYYNNINPDDFHQSGSPITSFLYTPGANDTIVRIPIDNSLFRQRFVEIDSASKSTETNFQNFFKGFYITAQKQSNPGSIISVNLNSGFTNMTLHYQNSTADSLKFMYYFGGFVSKVNLLRQNYSGTFFYPKLNQTAVQDSVVFVQSMGGLTARIQFSDLSKWRDSVPVVINKARLVFPVERLDATAATFSLPASLILLTKNDKGQFETISDYDFGSNYFGGSYNLETKSYAFNITNHLQKFIQRKIDEVDLYLLVNDIATTANRVVLTSGNHSNPIRLEITYHKF